MWHKLRKSSSTGQRIKYSIITSICAVLFLPPMLLSAATTDLKDSLGVVSKTNTSGIESQEKIDTLSRETQGLLEEYRKLHEGTDYQAAYTRELQELELAQQHEIESLHLQIAQAKITRQRILPLMRSMADALEKFVVLDLPFHQQERISSVLQLKLRLNQPDLSVSDRFRLLLEAYQLEQDYGGNIEAWRGPLAFQGDELSVQYLRVGRVALYFQTLDGKTSGYWNVGEGSWLTLDEQHNRELAQALRVARSQVAPQLLQLPLSVPESES